MTPALKPQGTDLEINNHSLIWLFFMSGTMLRAVGIHRIQRWLSGGSEYLLMCPEEFTEDVPLDLVNKRLNLGFDKAGEW